MIEKFLLLDRSAIIIENFLSDKMAKNYTWHVNITFVKRNKQ